MADARTGGQYSLVRAALGAALVAYFAWFLALGRAARVPELGGAINACAPWFGLGFALLFALGKQDRWVGLALLPLWLRLQVSTEGFAGPGVLAVGGMLLLHAFLPRAPFGALDARGRVDPDGGWRMPVWVAPLVRGFLALGCLLLGGLAILWTGRLNFSSVLVVLALLLLMPRTRPFAWLGLLVASCALWALTREPAGFGLVLVHLLVFDPAWVAPAKRAGPTHLFYDGSCALCHGFVRFVLAEDRAGVVRFAPLQGPSFAAALSAEQRARLPDSVVVLDDAGHPLVRSEGVRHVLATLGGAWRVLAILQGVVPRVLRDLVYDGIAGARKRVFGTTQDACPLMPRELGARFDP